MTNPEVGEPAHHKPAWYMRVAPIALLAFAAAVAILLNRPPTPSGDAAPATEFSTARALVHLRAIASEPRPVGSEGHRKARETILSILRASGLEPEVQSAPATATARGRPVPGGVLQNIIAVLKGAKEGPALLVASHYDSVPDGPGASDDGAAVAATLEVIRALRAGPPLERDIVFLFTDGEELYLLGAQAFINDHPLAKRIGAALNFEARGSSGPVYMFQTSPENGWLIGELAAAAPFITASSFSGDLYRKMPNDTDFTVFLRAGIPGMNFAYIGDLHNYHTAGDTIENLDLGSLEQHGTYMLSLVRRLGSADLGGNLKAPDAVYFNLIGHVFIHYSSRWVLPIAALAAAVFLGALAFGAKRGRIRPIGAAAGYGVLLALLLVTAIVLGGATLAATALDARFSGPLGGRPYDSPVYMAGFTAIALAIGAAGYSYASRRLSPAELSAGALGVWLSLAAPASFTLPGASYLFTLPFLCGAVGLWALVTSPAPEAPSPRALAVLTIALAPALTALAPTIHGIYNAMTVLLSAGVLLFVTLALGLCAAPLAIGLGGRRT